MLTQIGIQIALLSCMKTSNAAILNFMIKNPLTIESGAPLDEAILLMNECDIRHLPVMREGHLVGVLSERDILNALVHQKKAESNSQNQSASVTAPLGSSLKEASVADVMSRDPYWVQLETPVSEVLRVMAGNKLGCAIIKGHGGSVTGIFTTTDALKLASRKLSVRNQS